MVGTSSWVEIIVFAADEGVSEGDETAVPWESLVDECGAEIALIEVDIVGVIDAIGLVDVNENEITFESDWFI